MRKTYKYNPEDIEYLMLHKSFDELYDSEKQFILKHLKSAEEYGIMRASLLAIKAKLNVKADEISPNANIKKQLVSEYQQIHTKSKVEFWISFNQLFAIKAVYRNPSFQFALAAIIIVFVVSIFIINKPPDNNVISVQKNQQIAQNIKNQALKNIETIIGPYIGTGEDWENIPESVRESVSIEAQTAGIPIETIQKLISNRDSKLYIPKDQAYKTMNKLITDVNKMYLEQGKLDVQVMSRGTAWLDTGTHASLLDASNYVAMMERRQGLKIACLEEISLRKGWIDMEQLEVLIAGYGKSSYADYLKEISTEINN